jgi:hypothetical protein
MDLFLTTGPLTGEAAKRKTLAWPTKPSIALGATRGKIEQVNECIKHRQLIGMFWKQSEITRQ